MTCLEALSRRIASTQATVGVIGPGYVGLPLALLFEESGFPVIGRARATRESGHKTQPLALLLERPERETPLAGRRADDTIASGVMGI